MCLFLCGKHCPLLFSLTSAYFSSQKNVCKKHFDITCLLLFRNKNKPVCFANSAEWDIYKVQYIRITMVL